MTTWQNRVLELEERGWSLTGLAKATGASIGAISDLKQGRTREPRANVALQLHELHASGALPAEVARPVADDAEEHSEHVADPFADRVGTQRGQLKAEGAVGFHDEQLHSCGGARA